MKTKKIGVIGGGIFGITASIILGKNHQVELFERNSDILKSASGSNQYRVHRGYHYPRSKETVEGIQKSEQSFHEVFSDCIVSDFEHYYCIAKENSLTSSTQFIDFCNNYNLDFIKSTVSCVNNDSVDLCVLVKESLYDPEKLRKVSWQKLKENNVKTHLNYEVTDKIFEDFDWVINCTYANLNKLFKRFPEKQKEYQFELCEKPVVQLPPSFKNKSIVIMDGPFMCIDPLANTDYHLLCNVVNEVHQTNIGKYPEFDKKFFPYLDSGIIKKPPITNFQKFIESGTSYFPEIHLAKHIGSMFTIRVVPPRVENTDARPTIVKKISENVISMFSGKITTCVDAAKEVEEIIKND